MKLYLYRALFGEEVPKDVTHVIIDHSVTTIKKEAFYKCYDLVSVIMGDNVKRIEWGAFCDCRFLRFLQLSRTLEYIGWQAFAFCESLEVLFLPSTVKEIEDSAFYGCRLLRFIILPHDIETSNVGNMIIYNTGILQIAEAAGIKYEGGEDPTESIRRVNEWLIHHMDEWPFHKLCYSSSVTTKQINDYLTENGNDVALTINPHDNGMTPPLHILSMNPHAPADAILALLKANINAATVRDHEGKTPLYYALRYNPCAFVRMYSYLCEHTNINTIEFDIQPNTIEFDNQPWRNDPDPGRTPLHVLAQNPFAPANVIAAFLELKMEDAFCPDNKGLSPLDYAEEHNVEGLVSMIAVLCNHRNSISSFEGGGGGGAY
jgi:hypothetical protein